MQRPTPVRRNYAVPIRNFLIVLVLMIPAWVLYSSSWTRREPRGRLGRPGPYPGPPPAADPYGRVPAYQNAPYQQRPQVPYQPPPQQQQQPASNVAWPTAAPVPNAPPSAPAPVYQPPQQVVPSPAANAPSPAAMFPPGVALDTPPATGAAARHVSAASTWAADQLDSMFSRYAHILSGYPQHIQDMVKRMPEHRFREIRRARVHYAGEAPIVAKEESGRSGFTLSNRYGANSATAANVCFDTRKSKLILYRGSGGNIISATDKNLMTKVGHAGFKWTWKVEETSGSPPSSSSPDATWYEGMTVLASPAFDKHTTHFSEAVTLLFHAALHPETYPWWAATERVIHVKVKSTDFNWSKDFMRVCMSGLKNHKSIPLIWRDQMKRGPHLHCFRRAGLMAQQTHEYGYHADPWEAQLFRESAFQMFDVPEPPRLTPNQKLRTTVVGRKGRKKMANVKDVIAVIKQTELAKFDYLPRTKSQPVYFEKDTSFKDQITVMRFTDVLVGLHGSGLNNAMFCEPGSVVISIMPSNYIEYEWHNFISGSGVTYLIQMNTDVKKYSTNCRSFPAECATLRPFQAKTSKCVPMWYCDAKVDLGAIEALYRSTNFLIRSLKRELAKGAHNQPFNGGRAPSGNVAPLDE